MPAYDDLVPGATRKRSAYEDLLPARTPAPVEPPAEVADAAVEASPPGTFEGPTRLARAAMAAEPYVVPPAKTMQAIASGYPVAETAANVITGGVAMPLSGLAGVAALAAKKLGYEVDPGAVVHKVGEALTYQPRSDLGQHLTGATLYPLEELQKRAKAESEAAQDRGASPLVATARETLINAAPLLFGGGGRGRVGERPAPPRELPLEQRIEPTLAEAPRIEPEAPKRIEEAPPAPVEPVVAEPPQVPPAPKVAEPVAPPAPSARTREQVIADIDALTQQADQRRIEAKDESIKAMRPTASDWMTPEEFQHYQDLQAELAPLDRQFNAGAAQRVADKRAARVAAGAYDDLIPQAGEKEAPTAPPPAAEKLGLDHPAVRSTLEEMAKEAGWAEVGGRMIRQKHSEVAGDETITRTKWLPKADWWPGRPGSLNEAQTAEAVRKALAGEPLKKREQAAIDYMVEVAGERVAERQRISNEEWAAISKDLKEEGSAEPLHRDIVDSDLVAKANAIDEGAVERAAMKFDNDDAAFMAEVKRIVDEHENQAAARRWQEDRAASEGESGAGLQLSRYTEKELADRARAAKDVEARRAAEETAAENKRAADAQRGDFELSGSDRTADLNPKQGTLASPAERAKPKGPTAAVEALKKEFPSVDFYVAEHSTTGVWKLHDLRVPKKERGAGIGTRFMERLTELADEANARLVLSAAERGDMMGTTSKARLKDFYKRFGFVENKGRRKDFTISETMYRDPVEPKNLGAPAGTAVGPRAAAPAAPVPPQSRVVPSENARPDAIRKAMQELFDTVVSEKHQGAKNLGTYRIKPETIRVRNRNDLRTISHEVGHHISNRNKSFRAVMRAHDAELIPMMPQAYKQMIAAGKPMPKKLQIEEGFAEFIAEYLADRPVAKTKAPNFYKAFEQWLDANKPYKQAIAHVSDMIGAHQALGPAERILAKVGAYKPPLAERAGALVSKDAYDAFVQSTLDKWQPLKAMVNDLAPGAAPSKNPYVAARLLAGDAAVIEDWVGHFTSPFDYAKRLDPKNYGQGLKQILDPVLKKGEDTINAFKAYLIARRAFELKKAGKENLLSTEEIAQGLTLETPEFKKVAAEVYAYNDRLLDYAVEGGLLSPDVAAKFKQYTAYIPFFRESEGAGKPGGRGEPFKRLTGGTQNLRDPIANMIQNTANIIHATNRNAVLQKAVELARAVPGGGRWLEAVPLPQQAHNLATKRIIDQLESQGVQVDTSMASALAQMQSFFMPSGKGDAKTRTIVYKEGGELKAAQVNDPLLWKAVGNMPPLELGLIGKILAFPASTLRAGVVLDPTFMVRNFVRDTLSATIQSKGTFIPVASTAEGIRLMAQNKDAYKLWRSFGGAFADQFREPQEAAAALARMAKRGGFSVSSIVSPMRLLDALKKVGSFSESGSRIGEFAKTYEPGNFESAVQAALNSREVSTDFGMKGGSDAIQVLTRITPFMNPAMQGLYKTARVVSTGDGKAVAAKAATIGTGMALASIALALINSDEDWYKRLEDWERATYWHANLGGEIWRIPKPFEYGALFATLPENIALLQRGKQGWQDFKSVMLQTLGQVFGFRVIPQAATIVAEPWANKSFFTGRKIVPDRNENLEPGLQANPSTSKTAQVAGEAANVSPAMIDNMVRNTFGTVGVHVSTVADLILEASGAVPPSKEKTWRSWPVLKAFVHDPDNPNTKQQTEFYDALQKYRRAVATVKEYKERGEEAKAEAYAADKEDEIAQAKRAETAAKRLAKLRKAIRQIEFDRDMSPAEKRAEVNARNEEMRDVIEEQTPLYQAAKKAYPRPATEGGN